jgi:hypothetical protein
MKTLRDLAVKASYKAIIAEFNSIFQKKNYSSSSDEEAESEGQPPAKKKTKVVSNKPYSVEVYLLNQKEREEALKELKKKLDYYLIGAFSVERQRFVDRFIKSYSCDSRENVNLHICLLSFFKCLLDESFQSFDFTGGEAFHPFQEMVQLEQLFPVISKSCPYLQSLSLLLGLQGFTLTDFIPPLNNFLSSFKHFTSLAISFDEEAEYNKSKDDYLLFLSALGESCPKLIFLDLGFENIPFGLDQLLSLNCSLICAFSNSATPMMASHWTHSNPLLHT